ncbi:MAG: DMT family transporter [Lentisphaeria bacterium]|nr:DMT family transporter [Lentisphaeria bacterium]
MDRSGSRRFFGIVCLVASCIMWSGNYVIGKLLMSQHGLSPSAVSFWRFLAAGTIMFAAGLVFRGPKRMFALSRRDWFELAGQGTLGMCAVGLLMFWSERLTSAINASMLDALIPVAVMLGGVLLGNRLKAGQVIGIAISLTGCLFVIRVIGPTGIRLTRLGFPDLLIVGAAASWAGYVLWGKSTLQRVDSLVYTAWAMLFGMSSTFLYALADRRLLSVPGNPETYWLLALLVLLPTLGAFWAWNQATATVPLPLLNIVQYLIPVSAILFAHWLLHEPLDGLQVCGMALILAGVLLDPSLHPHRRRPEQAPEISSGR